MATNNKHTHVPGSRFDREGHVYLINDSYLREYFCDLTVSHWLAMNIKDIHIRDYPNAKIAAEIKNSPLYKALS